MMRFLPIIAATAGLGASVEAAIPVSPGTLEAAAKLPLVVILGIVCVVAIFFMYRQNRDNADRAAKVAEENCRTFLALAQGERIAVEKLFNQSSTVAKDLAESHARILQTQADAHNKDVQMLIEEIIKQRGV
jgi:cbb3-type cytochrome oxidase subunit 3